MDTELTSGTARKRVSQILNPESQAPKTHMRSFYQTLPLSSNKPIQENIHKCFSHGAGVWDDLLHSRSYVAKTFMFSNDSACKLGDSSGLGWFSRG